MQAQQPLTSDCLDDLVCYVADLEERVRVILVVFEEVEHTQTQHVKREANVATVVKPVQHLNTDTGRERGRERAHITERMEGISSKDSQ